MLIVDTSTLFTDRISSPGRIISPYLSNSEFSPYRDANTPVGLNLSTIKELLEVAQRKNLSFFRFQKILLSAPL